MIQLPSSLLAQLLRVQAVITFSTSSGRRQPTQLLPQLAVEPLGERLGRQPVSLHHAFTPPGTTVQQWGCANIRPPMAVERRYPRCRRLGSVLVRLVTHTSRVSTSGLPDATGRTCGKLGLKRRSPGAEDHQGGEGGVGKGGGRPPEYPLSDVTCQEATCGSS